MFFIDTTKQIAPLRQPVLCLKIFKADFWKEIATRTFIKNMFASQNLTYLVHFYFKTAFAFFRVQFFSVYNKCKWCVGIYIYFSIFINNVGYSISEA